MHGQTPGSAEEDPLQSVPLLWKTDTITLRLGRGLSCPIV